MGAGFRFGGYFGFASTSPFYSPAGGGVGGMTITTVNTTTDLENNGFVAYNSGGYVYPSLIFGGFTGSYASWKKITNVTQAVCEMTWMTYGIFNQTKIGFGDLNDSTFFGFSTDSGGWSWGPGIYVVNRANNWINVGSFAHNVNVVTKVTIGDGKIQYFVDGTQVYEEPITTPIDTNFLYLASGSGMYGAWTAVSEVKFGNA